ncbi:hypothetical protein [Glaciihabitans sp. UYNi722]|uniref:hypothetical protein n=1 Tax=Glaciihabitans sp. UYNi722 TaxID=3156344 RepID=UPI00339A8673
MTAAGRPEFGELLGENSALIVASSRGRHTRRRIQRIGVEHVTGTGIRKDSLDLAAARASFDDLSCKIHAPLERVA